MCLISWEAIKDRASEFYAALLILETGLIGVFCSFDLVLFYIFFEMTLIPLFFMIAIWGGSDRRWAAIKFFLYTLAGSLVTLSGLSLCRSLRREARPGKSHFASSSFGMACGSPVASIAASDSVPCCLGRFPD